MSNKHLSLLLAAPCALAAVLSVTNHAGRVVSGELGPVTNGTFTIAGRRFPLAVLPASEQKRVRAAAGLDVRSPREKRIDDDLAYELKRIDARLAEGEISLSEAEKLRALSRASAESRKTRGR